MNDEQDMRRLRDDLVRADYLVDGVLAAIGEAGQRALARNHSVAAERALAGREDALATLIRLFVLQEWQPAAAVSRALDAAALVRLGVLAPERGGFRAVVDIRPYADETDGTAGWVVSDHTATLDTRPAAPAPDHVLGLSPASQTLAQITPRRRVGRALDLGTGSGIQSLHLARHAGHVVATDINPRALELAGWTFALNDVAIDQRLGSLYEPVAGESFDLIATNPPFVISPGGGPRLTYRETDYPADGFMRAVVQGAPLAPGGSLHVVGNWAHTAGTPWEESVTAWVPPGCDAYVLQREVLDVYEYTEVWLADAGLAGRPGYRETYDRWLAYFDGLGIEAIGMGWITMVASGSPRPRVVAEHWPHPVNQLVADDLMAHVAALDLTSWSTKRVLAANWYLAPGTMQETTGVPGEPDPAHVVLRRTDGLQRAIEVDPGLGGVLGACDGELPLGVIIDAVADLAGVDRAGLAAEILPEFRRLVATTWLTPGNAGAAA
ncbi:MAG: methyltransferase [Propionibacteriaceae bacterium]|jgi:methylase of polypeptide subunit release factors|nr:methyltransferase [Propionibacteriaceae bacterium]